MTGVRIEQDLRCVQQCERAPRARCTGTYLYMLCIKPGTSTSRARRALTLLNAPQVRNKQECFVEKHWVRNDQIENKSGYEMTKMVRNDMVTK